MTEHRDVTKKTMEKKGKSSATDQQFQPDTIW